MECNLMTRVVEIRSFGANGITCTFVIPFYSLPFACPTSLAILPLLLLWNSGRRACRQLSFLRSTCDALCRRICIVNHITILKCVCPRDLQATKTTSFSCLVSCRKTGRWRIDVPPREEMSDCGWERKNNASRLANGSGAYPTLQTTRTTITPG